VLVHRPRTWLFKRKPGWKSLGSNLERVLDSRARAEELDSAYLVVKHHTTKTAKMQRRMVG
jgi:hypothetical protein